MPAYCVSKDFFNFSCSCHTVATHVKKVKPLIIKKNSFLAVLGTWLPTQTLLNIFKANKDIFEDATFRWVAFYINTIQKAFKSGNCNNSALLIMFEATFFSSNIKTISLKQKIIRLESNSCMLIAQKLQRRLRPCLALPDSLTYLKILIGYPF